MDLRELFTAVLEMSMTASIAIGCVLLARAVLKKAPRVFSYALWMVVLFRLLCPVSLPSPASVLNVVEVPRSEMGTIEYLEPPVQTPLETVTPIDGGQTAAPSVTVTVTAPTDWHLIGTWVWLTVACGLLVYGILSYVNLKRKLREAVPAESGVREIDADTTPFVLGVIRPVIYLPTGLDGQEREYILLHERFHLRHLDPQVRMVFFGAVCLHWFNPLVWIAFFLCARDMEMRCDEAVLQALGTGVRSDYAQSLLNFATGRVALAAPLAFGEGDTGKRVRNVLNWKKKAGWTLVLAAIVCAGVFLMTGCDPQPEPESPFGHSYRVSAVISRTELPQETPELFTLTSDTALIVRQDGQTVMYGALKKVAAGTLLPVTMPEGTHSMLSPVENAWKTDDDGWWLFQKEDGELWLWREGEYLLHMARTDLLGVSIKQPGIESYVEPVWYCSDDWNWLPDAMSTTLVNEGAQIVLMPEIDVDMILVSEEYYQRMADGEYDITTTDHFLEPDRNGDFLLEVSRRGAVHDDFAVYRVTVGGENYVFRLGFPVVPNETSVSTEVLDQINTVAWTGAGAKIVLEIPGTWQYDLVPAEPDGYAGGITFWPMGREEGKLRFEYYPNGFGVCGTGLENSTMTLAGQTVGVGTYDNEALWTFLSFGDDFAVWGEGHEHWWAEYGDEAMEILDSAELSLQAD